MNKCQLPDHEMNPNQYDPFVQDVNEMIQQR